jgi:CheY-like chemotaxis protein
MNHNPDHRTVDRLPPCSRSESPSPTVLCVDDDPNISEAIGRRLQRFGIRVLRAYHGMQGCWLAATEKPDVIVLDVAMPKGSGVEIRKWRKRNEPPGGQKTDGRRPGQRGIEAAGGRERPSGSRPCRSCCGLNLHAAWTVLQGGLNLGQAVAGPRGGLVPFEGHAAAGKKIHRHRP